MASFYSSIGGAWRLIDAVARNGAQPDVMVC